MQRYDQEDGRQLRPTPKITVVDESEFMQYQAQIDHRKTKNTQSNTYPNSLLSLYKNMVSTNVEHGALAAKNKEGKSTNIEQVEKSIKMKKKDKSKEETDKENDTTPAGQTPSSAKRSGATPGTIKEGVQGTSAEDKNAGKQPLVD